MPAAKAISGLIVAKMRQFRSEPKDANNRMKSFNPTDFRREFPAINDEIIYLDSAATALKPRAMIEATQLFYQQDAATVHRSQHQSALSLTARFEATRQQVADFINAPDAENIIWTRGTTEAVNLVAQSYARPRLQAGDEIIVSEAEHHANLIPGLWLPNKRVPESLSCRSIRIICLTYRYYRSYLAIKPAY